jgi:uncharacterized protein involved in exopolysaccharide biosynthesis
VIRKVLEAFFRHKRLVLLPVVLIPLVVTPVAFFISPATYETRAGIWADRPTYLTLQDQATRDTTPADEQSERLNELLRTRTFLVDLARRTSLAPLVGSVKGEERIQQMLQRDLKAYPNGPHLVELRFRAATPQLSFEVLNGLVEAFKDRAAASQGGQASLAISFYQGRAHDAEGRLAESSAALSRYTAGRRLTVDPLAPGSVTSVTAADPQLADLLSRVEADRREVERTRASLEQAQLQVAASQEGQELGFQVIDPPRLPIAPTRELRKMLLLPVAALFVGLGISATLLILLVAMDRTVRSEADLAPTARILATLPWLETGTISQRAGPNVTRLAIGFVAGTALPSPDGGR